MATHTRTQEHAKSMFRSAVEEQSPSSIQIPGYRVGAVLGRGAMGVVFRAVREQDGRVVALKTVRGTNASTVASVRREIVALSRIRYPGIARIVDHGVHESLPWYAMELLKGTTLRDLIERRNAAREDAAASQQHLRTLLTIVQRLCRTLSFLHSQGIIHRDLKPENVFVEADGAPVLVDFGIAVSFGGSGDYDIAEDILELAGTPEYMSPEQIQGRGVDARTDLYALGCILFECLTGQTPFGGRTLGAVISRHLSSPPPRPSQLASDVTEQLERLVLRLLEKRPVDRLGYADDVATELSACGFGEAEHEASPRRAYVYRPEFVGRADVMAHFGPILRGKGELSRRTLIVGESGVGKTRMLLELASHASFRGVAVVPIQCGGSAALPSGVRAPTSPLAPFRSFLQRVADAAREGGLDVAERLLGGRGAVLAPYEPSLTSVIPAGEPAEAFPTSSEAARARVFEALTATLFAFAGNRALLLLIDDLQWADELTLSFLESLDPLQFDSREGYVVAACRSDDRWVALESSRYVAGFERVPLGRLSREAVGEMVSAMLALGRTPELFSEFLYHESNGNPFFVAEYVRAAIDQGLLIRDSSGRWRMGYGDDRASLSLPPIGAPVSVHAVMQRRIGNLTPEALALVRAAAVLGVEFRAETLESVAQVSDPGELDLLRQRAILEEADGGQLRFTHHKLKELAYGGIPSNECSQLHLRAAEAIEASAPDTARLTWLPTLAHHFALGGALERAACFFTLAGDRARQVFANGEALACYDSARELALELVETAGPKWAVVARQLEERCGDVLILTGSDEAARAALTSAVSGLPKSSKIWRSRLFVKCAQTLEKTHRHLEALAFYRDAETALGEYDAEPQPALECPEGWPLEAPIESESAYWDQWAKLQVERVWVHYWLADVDAMDRLVERVRPVIEARGRPAQHARFLQAVIHNNLRKERYVVSEETVALARRSLSAAEQCNDATAIAYAQFVLSFQLIFSGALEEARPLIDRALDGAKRTGDLGLQARCLTYSTVLYRLEGEVERTREEAVHSLRLGTALSMGDYIGAARANLAWVSYRSNDRDTATRETLAAIRQWEGLAPKYPYPFQWLARLHAAEAAVREGERELALENARAVLGPLQHRLPPTVTTAFSDAVEAWDAGDGDLATRRLSAGLDGARALGLV